VLYTSPSGERRIRVTNHCVPITTSSAEALSHAEPDVVAALWIKACCEEARVAGLEQAREGLRNRYLRMVGCAGPRSDQHHAQAEAPGMSPRLMERLSGSVVGAIKSVALRGGTDVHFDERLFMMRLLGRASVDRIQAIVRPKVWALGLNGPPQEVPNTRASLNSQGVFLLDNGLQLILWIGSKCSATWGQVLFGVDNVSVVDSGLLRISAPAPSGESPVKMALWALITQARKSRPEDFAQVIVAKEGDNTVEARFFWGLTMDAATFRGGEITVEELIRRATRQPQPGGTMPQPGGMMMPQPGGMMPQPGGMMIPQPGGMMMPQQAPPPQSMGPRPGFGPPPGQQPPASAPQLQPRGAPPPGSMGPQPPSAQQPPQPGLAQGPLPPRGYGQPPAFGAPPFAAQGPPRPAAFPPAATHPPPPR
jgi:hypothetical protein